MKLVFGPVPTEYVEHGDGNDFKGLNDKPYYYELSVSEEGKGEGTFCITDTCGRFLPFDFSNLDDLVLVLCKLKAYRDDKNAFEAYWDNVWNTGK